MSTLNYTGKLELVEEVLARYENFGGNDVLNAVLSACNEALPFCSIVSDPDYYARWTLAKASALRHRYFLEGAQEDIQDAQRCLETIISKVESDSWAYILALCGLGRNADLLWGAWVSKDLLTLSRGYYEQAMVAAKTKERTNSSLLNEIRTRLGRVLVFQSSLDGDGERLVKAQALISFAIDELDDLDPYMPYALLCLSIVHKFRWLLSGRSARDDLIKAEDSVRRAAKLAPCHRYRHEILTQLSDICRDRFTSGDPIPFLYEAIDYGDEAFQLGKRNGVPIFRLVTVMSNLGKAYMARFRAEGRVADVDNAVNIFRVIAVNCTDGPPSNLYELCTCLCCRFEETGQLIDIDDAIKVAQQALARSPATDPRTSFSIANLGNAFAVRFMHSQEPEDYAQAQGHLNDAVKRCRQNGPMYSSLLGSCLETLSNIHGTQYAVGRKLVDLELALEEARGSVAGKEETDTELPNRLSAVGEHLSSRFQATALPQDLMDSIINHEAALRLAPITSSTRHMMLWRYGRALRLRFQLRATERDFKKSVEATEDAAARAQAAHSPKQSVYLSELGACFAARHQIGRRDRDLATALDYYMKAAMNAEGLIADRFQAAVKGAKLAQEFGQAEDATEAFSAAVSLLPRIAWLGLTAGSRHAKLTSAASQIACDAAASAIMSGQLERAVELLDEGRSVLWRSILHLRTDLADLEDAAPDLAGELLAVGQELENDDMGTTGLSDQHAEQRAQRRRRAAEQWDAKLAQVRKLRGFESYLKPLPFSHLQQAAVNGPVIIINASKFRSDALIITLTEPVRSIALPELDFDTVKHLAFVLAQALRVATDRQGCHYLEQLLLDVCRRLWHGGLSSVATLLAQTQGPKHSAGGVRVWWIPTGLLSLLPIHCAGPYRYGQQGIPDLFISSYTTTLAALLAARTRRNGPEEFMSPPRMLAVGQTDVPGHPTLPHTHLEMQILASSSFAGRISFLYGSNATTELVTKALPHHSWIHCCCHGHWDLAHPLTSAFHLTGGPLTLGRLVQMRLANADFAFLSACHTARQAIILPDESMHLAAGLQIAGFRGVLATTWAMADRDGPALAGQFYKWLTIDGRPADARNCAEALHLAIGSLRNEGMPLYRWAPFVHYGI